MARNGRDVTEQFLTGPPGANPHANTGQAADFAANRKAVMVIYGHDHEAKDTLFDWLRAIGLQPCEWNQLVTASGAASPYIGQVLDSAFHQAQAVVALFTPDERVIATSASTADHNAWRLQARPNVLIEAGMALSTHPTRTVLVILGSLDLPSDLSGRHYIRLSSTDSAPLHDLANRLQHAGCETNLTGNDWLKPSRFPNREHVTPVPPEDQTGIPAPARVLSQARPAKKTKLTNASAIPQPSRLIRTITAHEGGVTDVTFSSDGVLLATASEDATAQLWHTASGKRVRTIFLDESVVESVALSPDGALLATAADEKSVQLWDIATGKCVRTFTSDVETMNKLAFNPVGSLLAATGLDDAARLWDVATGECLHKLTGHTADLSHVAFSPDGALLATTSEDKTACLWDVATGECLRKLTGHTADTNGVAFSPDGALLATGSSDDTARLWDLTNGKCVRIFAGHRSMLFDVAFSPNGALLATGSADNTSRLWDVATGDCVRTLICHTGSVYCVAFSPDGILATAGDDRTVRLWR